MSYLGVLIWGNKLTKSERIKHQSRRYEYDVPKLVCARYYVFLCSFETNATIMIRHSNKTIMIFVIYVRNFLIMI